MVTVRQIEKLWNARNYGRLVCDMLSGRPETSLRLESEFGGNIGGHDPSPRPQAPGAPDAGDRLIPACAAALLRLDELSQSHVALYAKLLKVILSRQESDGGWGDPLTTAICLRALLAGRGHGLAIDRGIQYLANLQKPEGIWPKLPVRRLVGDSFVSAFIMLQLAGDERFRKTVRFNDAVKWFSENILALDPETRRLWDHASIRCRGMRIQLEHQPELSWS